LLSLLAIDGAVILLCLTGRLFLDGGTISESDFSNLRFRDFGFVL
jgi:hypothetical protein